MKKINIDTLKKGDIILTTSSVKKPSGIIKKVTKSDISHAMISVSYGSVIDSTDEGVHARNIQKMFYDDTCAIYVLRPKTPLPEKVIDKVIEYARLSTGTRYSLLEAAAAVTPKLKISGRKQFCSRMVARAYNEAGIKLVDNPDYCTPEDLKNSKLLDFVKNPSITVSQEEIDFIQEEGDTTEQMRKITNNLLEKLRKFDKDLENINDINQLVVQQPELDTTIAQILQESGYLNFWQVEILRFPWRYDPTKMVQFYHSLDDPKDLLDYCHFTINQDKGGEFDHWEKTKVVYRELHNNYNFETFRILEDLYIKMTFYYSLRITSAEILLNVYGDIPEQQ